MKVLIIEDDQAIIKCIRMAFQVGWGSAEIISCGLGEMGIKYVELENPDIVILDLGLPDISGLEVLEGIRLFSDVPVIILTVRSDEQDIVCSLETGANDYITKPFKQMELLARVKACLRGNTNNRNIFKQGPFELNIIMRKVFYNGKWIALTPSETIVLQCLLRNIGKTVSYSELSYEIWKDEYDGAKSTIKVYIKHIREKLDACNKNAEELISAVVGVGYTLNKTW
ncbi:chemotaxis protein CheY [Dehalococcoides mccartyi CG1]|uniref:response regulator transcription factor n=1 Tax=Dehalococcoides mccartyi TaxID=61435 RepID=UPI0004E06D1A|nr:response regulator transcription factor [Dehalococcoides mccartyi]AII58452.1 chemotaxis protein CheY [Dehalococcoides mccartyi CG1]